MVYLQVFLVLTSSQLLACRVVAFWFSFSASQFFLCSYPLVIKHDPRSPVYITSNHHNLLPNSSCKVVCSVIFLEMISSLHHPRPLECIQFQPFLLLKKEKWRKYVANLRLPLTIFLLTTLFLQTAISGIYIQFLQTNLLAFKKHR